MKRKRRIPMFIFGLLAALVMCPLIFSCSVSANATAGLTADVYLKSYTTDDKITDTSIYHKLKMNVYDNGILKWTVSVGGWVDGYVLEEDNYKNTCTEFNIGEDSEYPYAGNTKLYLNHEYQLELVVPEGYAADLAEVKTYNPTFSNWRIVNNRLVFIYDETLREIVSDVGRGYLFNLIYYLRGANEPKPTPSPTPTPSPAPTAAPVPTTVPVSNKAVTTIDFSKTVYKLYAGTSSFTLKPTIKKGSGTVTYKSSASSVVAVNKNGKITVKKPGIAAVTVTVPGNSQTTGAKATVTFKILPKKVSSVKAKAGSAEKTLKVSWKKDADVSGYQIIIAKNRNFTNGKKTITVTSANKASRIVSGLKKGTWYVKVRAYKSVEGEKLYGKYSTIKKAVIK